MYSDVLFVKSTKLFYDFCKTIVTISHGSYQYVQCFHLEHLQTARADGLAACDSRLRRRFERWRTMEVPLKPAVETTIRSRYTTSQ